MSLTIDYEAALQSWGATEDHFSAFAYAGRLAVLHIHLGLPTIFDRDGLGRIQLSGIDPDPENWFDAYHLILFCSLAFHATTYCRFKTNAIRDVVGRYANREIGSSIGTVYSVHKGLAKKRGEQALPADQYEKMTRRMLRDDRRRLVKSVAFEEIARTIAGHLLVRDEDYELRRNLGDLLAEREIKSLEDTHAHLFREMSAGPVPEWAREPQAARTRSWMQDARG